MDNVESRSLGVIGEVSREEDGQSKRATIRNYIQEAEDSSSWCSLTTSSELLKDPKWVNCNRSLEFSDFSGKLVLLDFFTYCCINCIHIMPFLHQLEAKFSMSEGLIVIGVHSAKFPNEKVESNILKAIDRYNLQHPVYNDSDIKIWDEFSIKCWPTMVLISPNGKILFSIAGESYSDFIELFIDVAKEVYTSRHELDISPVTFSLENKILSSDNIQQFTSEICFPGKIAVDNEGERIAVSDSGNHRVIITDMSGAVLNCIGGSGAGYNDGSFENSKFNSPQGVTWHGKNTIFVADCNNHLIRKIDLLVQKVVTVCGTGVQGNDLEGGKPGLDQVISSPWDLVVGGSPRVADGKSILYIAMSGCHQIWAFILKTTDYQKGAELEMGTCIRYAGNGNEENRNNSYPHKAGFAQPSGLALNEDGHALYIADSESSTIRKMMLTNGAVQAVVGGDIDPTNLFAFGDVDGKGRDAKLQHPIGVCWNHRKNVLYVADTYNHKIKIIDPKKKTCVAMEGIDDTNGKSVFNEPSGICLDPLAENLYVADTNNHDIKIVSLKDGQVKSLKLNFDNHYSSVTETDGPNIKIANAITRKNTPVKCWDKLIVSLDQDVVVKMSHGNFVLSADAPSSWQFSCSVDQAEKQEYMHMSSGKFKEEQSAKLDFKLSQVLRLLKAENLSHTSVIIRIEAVLYYCLKDSGVCAMHNFRAHLPVFSSTERDERKVSGETKHIQIEIS